MNFRRVFENLALAVFPVYRIEKQHRTVCAVQLGTRLRRDMDLVFLYSGFVLGVLANFMVNNLFTPLIRYLIALFAVLFLLFVVKIMIVDSPYVDLMIGIFLGSCAIDLAEHRKRYIRMR